MTASRPGSMTGTFVFVVAGALLLAQAPSNRATFAVWAVHDGVKVKRDDRAHPDRGRNAVWDGRTIRLVAARNEVLAFQVIVEAGARGTRRADGGASRADPPRRR